MARPLFNAVAAARLDITVGSSSRAAYYALVAQYQFGTPVIYGRSPQELAATIGVPLYSQPGDPGIAATVPGVVVVSFPYPTPSVVVGGVAYPVSTAVAGGTIVGANYIDGNGALYPDVDWQWQISVEGYSNLAAGQPGVGTFDQQIVTWTGDGTANRLIPTTFDLTQGTVAIWGCGGAGAVGTTEVNFFRHNNTTMLGTSIMGLTNDPIVGQGIVSFEAGGFRVTAGNFVAPFANTNNVPYVAVVWRDTTTDRRYLRTGTYKNRVGGNFGANCITGSSTIFFVSGGVWSPAFDNLLVQDSFGDVYTFHYVSPTQATICAGVHPLVCGGYARVSGTIGFTFITESPHPVPINALDATVPRHFQPTHLWVWGSTVAYKSFEFPGLFAVTLADGGAGHAPVDDMLTALNIDTFTVQTAVLNGSVWAANVQYDYLALSTDAALLAKHFFTSFTGIGAGVAPTVINLPFTPSLVFGRQGGAAFSGAACFRGPAHTGTLSTLCAKIGGGSNNLAAIGITDISPNTVSFGIEPAPSGDPFYGWAFLGGASSLVVPATPVYQAVSVPDALAPTAPSQGCLVGLQGISGDGGQGCAIGTGITPSV